MHLLHQVIILLKILLVQKPKRYQCHQNLHLTIRLKMINLFLVQDHMSSILKLWRPLQTMVWELQSDRLLIQVQGKESAQIPELTTQWQPLPSLRLLTTEWDLKQGKCLMTRKVKPCLVQVIMLSRAKPLSLTKDMEWVSNWKNYLKLMYQVLVLTIHL